MKAWLRLHVSNICNFRCSYCHVFQGSENSIANKYMSQNIMQEALDQYIIAMESWGLEDLTISLYGGETLLARKSLFPFMEKIGSFYRGIKIRWILNSNGSLLTKDDVVFFQKFEGFEFHLSIDGPEEVQIKSRPDKSGKNSFESAIHALLLLKGRKIFTQINSYVMPENEKHLCYLVDLAVQYEVETLYMDVLHFQDKPVTENVIQKYTEFYAYGVQNGRRIFGPWSSINFDGLHEDHIENKILGVEVQLNGTFYNTVFPLSKKESHPLSEMSNILSPKRLGLYRSEVQAYFQKHCNGCSIQKYCNGGAIAQYHYHVLEEKGHNSACGLYRQFIGLLQQKYSVIKVKNFLIFSQYPKHKLKIFLQKLEDDIEALEKYWGVCSEPFRVILFKDLAAFRFYTNTYNLPEWVRGVALGSSYLQVGYEVTSALRHELAHLFIDKLARQDLPIWFCEGLCEFFARTSKPHTTKSNKLVWSFQKLNEINKVEDVFVLDSRPPAENEYYMQSCLYVSRLISETGWDTLLKTLKTSELPFEIGLQNLLGKSLESIHQEWIYNCK